MTKSQDDDRRSAEDPPENSVCAERSDAPGETSVIARLFSALVSPTSIAMLEAEIAAMGEDVRRQERARIAAWLRTQAEDGPEPHDVERAFRLAANDIERGYYPKEKADAAE